MLLRSNLVGCFELIHPLIRVGKGYGEGAGNTLRRGRESYLREAKQFCEAGGEQLLYLAVDKFLSFE